MKKIIFLSIIFSFCINFAKSQKTTTEEYTYITSPQGLAFDKKGGREIKAGYRLEALNLEHTARWPDGEWKRIKMFLLKRNSGKDCAIVVEFSDAHSGLSYKCICGPDSQNSLIELSDQSFNNLGKEWDAVLGAAFVKLARMKLF